VIVELVALGDRDCASEDDHQAGSGLADGPKRFTDSERVHVGESTHPLEVTRIERGINLIVPPFEEGLQLGCAFNRSVQHRL